MQSFACHGQRHLSKEVPWDQGPNASVPVNSGERESQVEGQQGQNSVLGTSWEGLRRKENGGAGV